MNVADKLRDLHRQVQGMKDAGFGYSHAHKECGETLHPILPEIAAVIEAAENELPTCIERVDYARRCGAPAEFILWGKLIEPQGLGPRCYDHAAMYVEHRSLGDPAHASVDLRPRRRALAALARRLEQP